MDNEEIKKLLQELKETSDESPAGRSKVVKIHFDTPWETEMKARAKQKAEEAARKKELEEEARREAEEEAARQKAEKKAQEAASEAKPEAAGEFSATLESDLKSGAESADSEDSSDDLESLNWNFEHVQKPGSLIEGLEETKESAGESAESEDKGRNSLEENDTEADGLNVRRLFDGFRSGISSGIENLKERFQKPSRGETLKDGDIESPSEGEKILQQDEGSPDGAKDFSEEKISPSGVKKILPGEEISPSGLKEILPEDEISPFEEERELTKETGATSASQDAVEIGSSRDDFGDDSGTDGGDTAADRVTHSTENGLGADAASVTADPVTHKTGDDAGAGTADGSDAPQNEDWKKRLEESELPQAHRRSAPGSLLKLAGKRGRRLPGKRYPGKSEKTAGHPEQEDFDSDAADFLSDTDENRSGKDSAGTAASFGGISALISKLKNPKRETNKANTAKKPLSREDVSVQEEAVPLPDEIDQTAPEKDIPGGGDTPSVDSSDLSIEEKVLRAAAQKADKVVAQAKAQAEKENQRNIEVVDLNESANHRGVEVIPFETGKTGPIPQTSAKQENGRLSGLKIRKGAFSLPAVMRGYVSSHRSVVLIGGICAAALAVVLILTLNHVGPGGASSGGSVTADDGLSVTVREQPSSYTREGDVRLSLRADGEIQSVTVNEDTVDNVAGSSKAAFTYHATGGTLKIMVVSTDRVRNATVKLAYVDSKAPSVSVSDAGGKIILKAQDDESGVEGVWYGIAKGLSDVPQYTEYTEPFTAREGQYISYYAADKAGNRSVPVTSTLEAAKSVSFGEETYSIYPGSEKALKIITKPEDAYCNNLQIKTADEKIAVIENNSVLKAVGEGETTVTLSADGLKSAVAKVVVSKSRTVKLSMIGDCTLGTDPTFSPATSFNAYQTMNGNSYFFSKVKDILSQDDITMANCEGTFTTSDSRVGNPYAFKGDPSYAGIFKDGSVEVVTLANNHINDYGDEGQADTRKALEDQGIEWCSGSDIAYEDVNGVKTAFIGIYALDSGTDKIPDVQNAVSEAKAQDAQIIVVHFHWSQELATDVDEDQKALAHAAIDAGAALVVGTHPHVLQGIEKYNGRYIVYSLANFCFGGNVTPADSDSIIFQQTFTVDEKGVEQDDNLSVIPVCTSSDSGSNNYQPVPVTSDAASAVMTKLNTRSQPFGLNLDQYETDGTASEGQ